MNDTCCNSCPICPINNDPETVTITIESGDYTSEYGYNKMEFQFPNDTTCDQVLDNIFKRIFTSMTFSERQWEQAIIDLAGTYLEERDRRIERLERRDDRHL